MQFPFYVDEELIDILFNQANDMITEMINLKNKGKIAELNAEFGLQGILNKVFSFGG